MADASPDRAKDIANEKESVSYEVKLKSTIAEILEKCKSLQDTAIKYSARLKSEGDSLGEKAIALEKEIRNLLEDVNTASEKEYISLEVSEELEEDLIRARGMVYEGDVAALLPHKANGLFLGLFLGQVNVKSARRDVRFRVKEEYNTYRDRTAVLFLTFPLLLIFLKYIFSLKCFPEIPVQIYKAWLLFFYTSLALRENILRINGSDIRPWWIYHHYFAMLMSVISLTWGIRGPYHEKNQHGVSLFLFWAIIQGIAMLLQNRYQRQRLYTRIALGKAGRMDVVWGETAGMKGQLWILYPLLFILQGFQFFIGIRLLQFAALKQSEWQVAACGTLLVFMAFGNFWNTVGTVVTKARFKAKMKKKGGALLGTMASSSNKSL